MSNDTKGRQQIKNQKNWYIIVTSVNPVTKTDDNIAYLLKKVTGLVAKERQEFRFRTLDVKGKEMEFWLAGWPVAS